MNKKVQIIVIFTKYKTKYSKETFNTFKKFPKITGIKIKPK